MQIQREVERQSLQITGEYDLDKGPDGSDFRERMLMNNSIEGLLNFEINIVNNEKTYEYNILEMESLDSVCKKEKLKIERLTSVLDDILQSVFRGREFMLAEGDYILDPNLIFINKKGKTYVPYYSGYSKPIRSQLQALAEFLMNNVDYSDENAVLVVYTVYMRAKEENCSLEDITAYIRSKSSGGSRPAIKKVGGPELKQHVGLPEGVPPGTMHNTESQDSVTSGAGGVRFSAEAKIQHSGKTAGNVRKDSYVKILLHAAGPVQIIKSALAILLPLGAMLMVLKSSFILDKSGGRDGLKVMATVMLCVGMVVFLQRKIWAPLKSKIQKTEPEINAGMSVQAEEDECATMLLFDKNVKTHPDCSLVSDDYPPINMDHFPFCIGKDAKNTDYCLDVSGVSRRHLLVNRVGIEFTISDLNSTNGTYLNDSRIAPNTSYRITKMDKITIGKCVFYMN